MAAYAISIHKSQGSEYPAVVIPLMTQHYMLLQRNLIYTGGDAGQASRRTGGRAPRFGGWPLKQPDAEAVCVAGPTFGAAPEAAGPQTEGERT